MGSTQSAFETIYGCKQGGPASPRLFALYIDDLEEAEVGIKVGNVKMECILYADDVLLLANDQNSLQELNNVGVTTKLNIIPKRRSL